MRVVAAVLAGFLAPACFAASVPAAADPGPARQVSWASHRGVELGTPLRTAARQLDTRVQRVPCPGQDFVYTGRTGDGVWLQEGGRDDGRVNDILTTDRRIVGPWGVRVGMPVRTVAAKATRNERRLWSKNVRNPYYDTVVRWSWVVGPDGHVLQMTRKDGHVRSMSVMTDASLARQQRRPSVDC